MAFVYILRCADGTFYFGHTDDLFARLALHQAGTAAEYTARRRPVEMVYAEEYPTLIMATRRERQLKRWSREKKLALVDQDINRLKSG